MNRSELWGFEVSHIIAAVFILAGSNVVLSIAKGPLIISWVLGIGTLLGLRILSHGQKNGHLELTAKFVFQPRVFLGHQERRQLNVQLQQGNPR